jgi:hypothetical protein
MTTITTLSSSNPGARRSGSYIVHRFNELLENARWYFEAARNASDPRLKAPMQARARDFLRQAEALRPPFVAAAVD